MSMSTNDRKDSPPLPEVVVSFRQDISDPIDWDVRNTPSSSMGVNTDLLKGQMTVPFFDDEVSRFVRARELTKARITPIDTRIYDAVCSSSRDVKPHVLAAAENLRISSVTAKLEYDNIALVKGSEKNLGMQLAQAGTPEAWEFALVTAIELIGSKAFDSFASGIRSVKPEWSKSLRGMVKHVKPHLEIALTVLSDTAPSLYDFKGEHINYPRGFNTSMRLAQILDHWSGYGPMVPDDVAEVVREEMFEKAMSSDGDSDDDGDDDGDDAQGESASGKTKPFGEGTPDYKLSVKNVPDDFEFDTGAAGQFADLRIDDTMPLIQEVSGYLHRRKSAMTTGRRVLYPSRLLTDPQKRIFGSKVRVKGGIVVVDISGSMSLTNENIEDILTSAPAAVILAYSQRELDQPNAWILASRGRRVDPKHIGDIGRAGNGVDGPALTWAIRKRKHGEPIIWISDGMVTSSSDGWSDELFLDCVKLVKKHKIICYADTPTAVKAFKRGVHRSNPPHIIREALITGKSPR